MAKTDNQNDMVSLSDRPCGTSLRLYDGNRKNISRVVFLRCRHEGVRCSFTLKWFAVAKLGARFPHLDKEGKPRAAREVVRVAAEEPYQQRDANLVVPPPWRSATSVAVRHIPFSAEEGSFKTIFQFRERY